MTWFPSCATPTGISRHAGLRTDQTEVRKIWRARRDALDREFEAHIARVGPARVDARVAVGPGSLP
jgi:hypothetical protein